MKSFKPETAFLKPGRPGLLCPYPGRARRFLPEAGAMVRLNTWWRMRLLKGDAVRSDAPAKSDAAPKTSKTSKG